MTTNMLAISNMFTGTNGAGPALAKSTAVKQRNQLSQSTVDDTPVSNDSEKTTSDNTAVKERNRPNEGSTGEFNHNFRKEITTEVPQKARLRRKVQKQEPLFNAAGQQTAVLPLLVQWSLKAGHGPEGIVKKIELKSGLEHAQLFNKLSKDKSLLRTGKTAKPQNSEPISVVNEKQIGLKETSPNTTRIPLSADISSNKDKNASQLQMPDVRLLAARGPYNEQSGKGFALQPLIRAHHGITTAYGKPKEVPVSNTFGSQQTPPMAGTGLKPQVLVEAAGEINNVIQKPAIARKQDVAATRNKPLSNPNILPVQDKPSGLQFQAVRIDPEKSPFIAENAVANKTVAGQPIRTQSQQFSGPLGEDVTEQGPNSPSNLAYQHLHRAQVHVSAGQNKGRDGSVSTNNAESGFEQILSGNNAATYIEEQTSIFPEIIKTDNLPTQTSPGGVSASITEQILESIHSSSSQQAGTQQITIRLNPPELGKVFIKFEEQENQIIGLVEVSKAQTRYEVEQALPQIVQNLADCGIQIKRLEVLLTDQNGQQSYGDESLQDGSFQQQHDLPGGSNPDQFGTIGANEPGIFENNSSYQDGLVSQMQITADSINILI